MQTLSVGFTLQELQGLDEYLSRPDDIAFASGSQQGDLGNSSSDFDLFVIYKSGLERLYHGPHQFWLLDPPRRVDMERLGFNEIVEAAERINAFREPAPESVRHLSFDDFDSYYRTVRGSSLSNPAGFAELLGHLDRRQCELVYAAWTRWHAGVDLVEARRLLEAGREEAAFVAARRALRNAVNGETSEQGYGWPNPKWAFVKLERCYGRDSLDYQEAWRLNGLGLRSVASYVGEVEAYCYSKAVPRLRLRSYGLQTPAWIGEVVEMKMGKALYLVHRRRRAYELDEASRFLCNRIDGKTPIETLTSEFAEQYGLHENVARYRTEEFIGRLVARGLLRLQDEIEAA